VSAAQRGDLIVSDDARDLRAPAAMVKGVDVAEI
jgi:hypothetical protein